MAIQIRLEGTIIAEPGISESYAPFRMEACNAIYQVCRANLFWQNMDTIFLRAGQNVVIEGEQLGDDPQTIVAHRIMITGHVINERNEENGAESICQTD